MSSEDERDENERDEHDDDDDPKHGPRTEAGERGPPVDVTVLREQNAVVAGASGDDWMDDLEPGNISSSGEEGDVLRSDWMSW